MIITRKATIQDCKAICDIYTEAVLNTTATFDIEAKSVEYFTNWLVNRQPQHSVLVLEKSNEEVLGYAALSQWSDKIGYHSTAEISIYLSPDNRGKGLGKLLLTDILIEGKKVGFRHIVARICTENEISIQLHKTVGFQVVGIQQVVGQKFGRWLDVMIMQKLLM
ncbi:MAG: GNAT family N-acetyltransferase [Bacteroidia bacterium]|nr:GNAT family N-acetyltransferase [Bacteroidia bacterium]